MQTKPVVVKGCEAHVAHWLQTTDKEKSNGCKNCT
jgi:hypothetical protein